jgi:predicted DNA-binding antitoxin AbrB/MazE fold protein
MEKTIRARFKGGGIEPLEKLEIEEGEELSITIKKITFSRTENTLEALRGTAGAWKGTIDAEELKRNIYSDRLIRGRTEPKL